jgi:hypothetical protein
MTVEVEYAYGYNEREINRIRELTQMYQAKLLEVWYEYFGR